MTNWINIDKQKPIATESGCWDGLRSSRLLVATTSRTYHVVYMYEGILDGSEFCNFYDANDFEISNINFWSEIDEII